MVVYSIQKKVKNVNVRTFVLLARIAVLGSRPEMVPRVLEGLCLGVLESSWVSSS